MGIDHITQEMWDSSEGFRLYISTATMRLQHGNSHTLERCDKLGCYGDHKEWTRYREEYNALVAEPVTEWRNDSRWEAMNSWCPTCNRCKPVLCGNPFRIGNYTPPRVEWVECGNCGRVLHYANSGGE